AWGGAPGAFALPVSLPLLARPLLASFPLLPPVSRLFAPRCLAGLPAPVAPLRRLAASSPSLVPPLPSALGSAAAAAVAKPALPARP
ncbi:aspartate ammonia-lyase, partial [Mycobacterium tuberculosis]